MLKFANPHAFEYLLALPIIWVLLYVYSKRSALKLKQQLGKKSVQHLALSISHARRRWHLILQSAVLVLFIIALARPQMGQKLQEVKSEGIELILAVDVSTSMLAEDIKPNRLEQVKKELSNFLGLRQGDRVGIIAFAGSAALIAPITQDKSALNMYLESLAPNTISSQGTDLANALELAQGAFARGGVDASSAVSVTRAIIVASDGEHNEQNVDKVMKQLNQDNIHVFTLAFGTERGDRIPLRDAQGYLKNFKVDRSGREVVSKVNGPLLKSLAQSGHGSFYHVTYGSTAVNQLAQDLDQLGKIEFQSATVTEFDEHYQIILLCGLIIALLDLLIGERRRVGPMWRGRFEVPGEGR